MSEEEPEEQEVTVDENGITVFSLAPKYLSPRVPAVDLTRVTVGEDTDSYVYVDPLSLFAIHRLVATWHEEGKVVKARGKGFKKFVRDTAEAAFPYWPNGGYMQRGPLPEAEILSIVVQDPEAGPPDTELGAVIHDAHAAAIEGEINWVTEPELEADVPLPGLEPEGEETEMPYPEVDAAPPADLPPGLPGLPLA